MVTLAQLQKQIAIEKRKVENERQRNIAIAKKKDLERQLKILKRSPGTKRNIAVLKRTGVGFKRLVGIGSKALLKQAQRIREQQLRDDALLSRGFKKTGSNVSKKLKKTNKVLTKKLRPKKRRRR